MPCTDCIESILALKTHITPIGMLPIVKIHEPLCKFLRRSGLPRRKTTGHESQVQNENELSSLWSTPILINKWQHQTLWIDNGITQSVRNETRLLWAACYNMKLLQNLHTCCKRSRRGWSGSRFLNNNWTNEWFVKWSALSTNRALETLFWTIIPLTHHGR